MLLIVAGAGASYDSILALKPQVSAAVEQIRLPLANQLFDARPAFEAAMREMPRVMPIAPLLQSRAGGRHCGGHSCAVR